MKIIVCVKQVPDTSGKVAVKEDGTMDRAAMATISNPDDMNALEAALQIKDQNPDVKVIVLSMGPAPTESMLRECLAMGADEAVLISAREFGGADTYATSSTITAAIRKIGVEEGDIVFCGRQAIDGDTAQVGPQIAEKLDIPQVTYVTAIDYQNGQLTVRRHIAQVGVFRAVQVVGELGNHRAVLFYRGSVDMDIVPNFGQVQRKVERAVAVPKGGQADVEHHLGRAVLLFQQPVILIDCAGIIEGPSKMQLRRVCVGISQKIGGGGKAQYEKLYKRRQKDCEKGNKHAINHFSAAAFF